MALTLTTDERTELERRVRSLKIRAEDARRARVILMLANGDSYSTIEATVPCYRDYINRWRRRFLADRLEGLRARYRGQPPTVLTPTMEARILAKTREAPPDGSTHWSTRKLGRVLKIHHNLVAKTWQRAGLQPHRFEPVLPLSPGRAERHGFEYYRHGTLSLFAALNTQSGEVLGQTVPRHTSAAFVEFLGDVVASQPTGRAIHVIADNLSTHKTQAVRTFLLAHPHVTIHFTPTYSSWLNQVELWLAKIERDLLARGVFTSVADLARKIRRYIRHYNKSAKPVRWSYRNPAHRISSTSMSTGH